jgi:hypothetical protein
VIDLRGLFFEALSCHLAWILCLACIMISVEVCFFIVGLSHIATLQQFEALLSIPGIDPKMVTVSFDNTV